MKKSRNKFKQEVKDLDIESCKTLIKETKDTNKYPVFINCKTEVLLKGPYYPKKSKDSIQSLSKSQ